MNHTQNMTERAARAEAHAARLAAALVELRDACGCIVLSTLPTSSDVFRLTTASNNAGVAVELWHLHRDDLETLALNAVQEGA